MPETMKVPGLKKPVNRTIVYAGGAAVVGIAVYAWWTKAGGAEDEEPLVFDEFGNPIAGPTPGLESPSVVDSNRDETVGVGFTTNAEWSQFAISHLQGLGLDAPMVSSAVGKFLQRRGLSAIEADVVGQAVAVAGWPPEGRPWTIITATTTPPPGGPPKPGPPPGASLPKPGGLKATVRRRTSIRFDWNPVPGADSYAVAIVAGLNTTIRTAVVSGGSTIYDATGLRPAHTYRIRVRARHNRVTSLNYATTTARTTR